MSETMLKLKLDRQSTQPLYQQLYDMIRHSITGGEMKPGEPLPSERELVSSLGITRPTLRQAFEQLEREGFVRRQHGVGTFVQDPSNWRPNTRVLSLGVIIWGTELSGYEKDLLGLLCAEAASHGMEIKTIHGKGGYVPMRDLGRRVADAGLDGVIAFANLVEQNLQQLAELRVPKVIMQQRARLNGTDHVVAESFRGVYDATRELVRLGHREIGFVGALLCEQNPGKPDLYRLAPETEFRFKAYRRALEDSGIAYRPELYTEQPYTDDLVDAWFAKRFGEGKIPTAYVVHDDMLAGLVMHAAQACGMEVPRDLSVTGFGNYMPPAQRGDLATTEIPHAEMARLAVERLRERALQGGMAGVTFSVDSTFKPGRSIGKPRAS